MYIRDRIKELRRVKASTLLPNPKNWRTHPDAQRDALQGVLAEIGYADALVARELDDGTLELLDGHLRAETTPEAEVPVLVVDLDDQEAAKLLTVLDPLAGLAETNNDALALLLDEVETNNDALRDMLDQMGKTLQAEETSAGVACENEVPIPDIYQIVIECDSEEEQKGVYERLTSEGYTCQLRVL